MSFDHSTIITLIAILAVSFGTGRIAAWWMKRALRQDIDDLFDERERRLSGRNDGHAR